MEAGVPETRERVTQQQPGGQGSRMLKATERSVKLGTWRIALDVPTRRKE